MSCGIITLGSEADCDNLPKGGTKPKVYAFNHEEIDSYVEDDDGRITSIVMASGKVAHTFTGFRNDAKKSEEVINPGVGLNQFKHNVGWVIYERTQEQKNNIERLARGRFVVAVENKGKDADAIEVCGIGVGLEIVPGPIRNAHENGGYFMVNFSTPEGEFESKLPQSLGSSYANALVILDALTPTDS